MTVSNGNYSGSINEGSGQMALTKQGSGTLTLSGSSNTYTGTTTVTGGTLIFTGDTSVMRSTITDNAAVVFNQTANSSFSQAITGSGTVTQQGTATLTLSGTNSYTGGTFINGGKLQITSDNNLGNATGGITLTNGGDLDFAFSSTSNRMITLGAGGGTISADAGFLVNLDGPITGSGPLNLDTGGPNVITLGGAIDNTYTGLTTILGNVALSSNGHIAISGDLQLNSSGSLSETYSEQIASTATFTDNGYFSFSGASQQTVTTLMGNGIIQDFSATAATLIASNGTFSGSINGAIGLTKQSSGTLTLSGTNGYNGTTTISGGTLIYTGDTSGLTGTMTDNAAVIFNQNSNSSFNQAITGSGTLTKQGTGTLTLSGTNNYTGGTFINGGTLQVASDSNLGAASGGVTINNGGTLSFTNTTTSARAITVQGTGGTISTLSSTPITVNLNGVITSTVPLNFTSVGGGGGGIFLSGTANNNITGLTTIQNSSVALQSTATALNGNVTINPGASLYELSHNEQIDSRATLTDNGTFLLSGGATQQTVSMLLGTGGAILNGNSGIMANLSVGSGNFSGLIFDGNGPMALTKQDIGTLILSGNNIYSGGTNLTNGIIQAESNSAFGTGTISFTGGTLKYGSGINQDFSSQFSNSPGQAYSIDTNGNSVTLGANLTSLGGSLTKLGAGTLTLSGANTYGATIIGPGAGTLIFTGNTSGLTGTLTNNSAVIFNQATNSIFSQVITGGGTLTKTGAGILTLSAANNYTGGTTVSGGTILATNATALGNASSNITLDGGNVIYTTGTGLNGTLTVGAGGGTLGITSGLNLYFMGQITGSGPLNLSAGTGSIIYIGTSGVNNMNSGLTTVQDGGVQLNSGSDFSFGGNVTINSGGIILEANSEQLVPGATLTDNGIFILGNTQTVATLLGSGTLYSYGGTMIVSNGNFSGIISDSSFGDQTALIKQNSGTLILTGTNSYSGGTTITGGTLQIGNGGTTGSITGNVLDNGALVFDRSNSSSFGGVISGSGSVTQMGGGSLTLSGASTYSGGTTLQSGTLILGNSQALGTGTLTTMDPTVVYTNAVNIANPLLLNGSTTLEVDNSDFATQSGIISGLSGLTKTGTGRLTLSNANTYSGGSTLSAGTLVIANANALGNGAVSVNGGTLMTDGINHTINVNGNYTQTGGTLALTITSPTVYDQLVVSGKATVGGTLALTLAGGAPGSGQTYPLIKTSQSVSGQFSTVTPNLPSIGATLVYSNNVTLQGPTPIPTPVPTTTPTPVTTPTPTTPTPVPTPAPTPQVVIYQKAFGDLYGNYLSPNEHGAASYIDAQDQTIKNASFGNLVSALNQISPNENGLRAAFDQLNPLKFHSFASSTAFNNTPFLIQQFDDYLSSHRSEKGEFIASNGGIDDSGLVINDPTIDPGLQTVHSHLMTFNNGAGSPAPDDKDQRDVGSDLKSMIAPEPETNRWNAFATGNVILGQDFSVSQSGLSNADITSENVQVGADYRFTPHLLGGVTFGYGHSGANLDSIGSAAYVDTYSPGLYAAYSQGNWYANSLFNYGFNNYSQHRNVQIGPFDGTARSKPTGNQIVLNSDGGYDFHHGHWTFGPTAGLEYVHLDINGYSESGLPGADLNVKEDQSDSLRSLLGGRVSYSFTGDGVTFTSHLNASWQHEFFDAARDITAQFNDLSVGSFTARTANPSRESALIDAGLDAQINKSISLFTDYTVQAGQQNYFGQSVELGMKVNF